MSSVAAATLSAPSIRPSAPRHATRTLRVVRTRAEGANQAESPVTRRSLGALLGGALLLANSKPSFAAYGDAAKVFGSKPTNSTGFIPYEGTGFSLLLPSRWVPTEERDSREVQLRYEDTYPANNLTVLASKTSKKSVADFGSPDQFLKENAFLFGDNVWQGNTRSEGGFKPNQVAAASVLEAEQVTGKDGKPHIYAHVLTRSADGNEGGKHHIISAVVSNGQLFIMKAQIGDKRWNKGGSRDSKTLQESFAVA